MTTHLKRLLALLLALLLCVAAAAAEDLAPVEIIPAEAAFVETVSAEDAPAEAAEPEEGIVVEQGEITLSAEEPEELTPVEGVPVEPAPEEPTPVEAVPEEAAPAADVVVEADPDAAVAAPALEPEPEPVPDPDAMVSAPGDPVLAVGSLTLGAKEKAQLTLLSGALPQDVGGVLASSDAKIATVDAAGLVTGKKPGSAVITLDGDSFAREMERIQAEQPDVVFLAGDFVDDDSCKADMLAACIYSKSYWLCIIAGFVVKLYREGTAPDNPCLPDFQKDTHFCMVLRGAYGLSVNVQHVNHLRLLPVTT